MNDSDLPTPFPFLLAVDSARNLTYLLAVMNTVKRLVHLSLTVILVAACPAATAAGADTLTWQEANKRSAELFKEGGYSKEAADLAVAAFDLYESQSVDYGALVHGQLLLNAVDMRLRGAGLRAALKELDRGVAVIAKRAGDDPVLIDVWKEAARLSIARGDNGSADRYYEKAAELANRIWGESDLRAVAIASKWAHDLRREHGYAWANAKLRSAREHAAKADGGGVLVAEIALALAKLEVERRSYADAIELYRALIEGIEGRRTPETEHILQAAYAQLEYCYEEKGDKAAASAVRERRMQALNPAWPELVPLIKIQPTYPHQAAVNKIEGSVTLKVTVAPDGSVRDARVIRSRPRKTFDEAAVEAVRKWKFKPKIVDGQPVEQEGQQVIDFVMKN